MMKKGLALVLATMMAFTPVLVSAEAAKEEAKEEVAEAVEETVDEAGEMMDLKAAEMEELIKDEELKGDYVEFDGYKIWIPEEMTKDEPGEDDPYSITYSSEDFALQAVMVKKAFESIDKLEEALAADGYDYDPIKVNGMDGFIYIDKENDLLYVDLVDGENDVEVRFTPVSDEDLFAVAIMLTGTVQKADK